jgi:hypothetical protein
VRLASAVKVVRLAIVLPNRSEYCFKYCLPVRLWEDKYSLQSAVVQRLGLREQRTIARGFYLNLIFYVEAGGL